MRKSLNRTLAERLAVNARKYQQKILIILTITSIVILSIAGSILASAALKIPPSVNTMTQEVAPRKLEYTEVLAILGGVLAVIGSTTASSLALREIARAGFAASAEKPEVSVWILLLGGLAEGIAIYGLLVAILILGKI
jgi:V/A-type H+-transporting ATPase subunit K